MNPNQVAFNAEQYAVRLASASTENGLLEFDSKRRGFFSKGKLFWIQLDFFQCGQKSTMPQTCSLFRTLFDPRVSVVDVLYRRWRKNKFGSTHLPCSRAEHEIEHRTLRTGLRARL